jgi:hypothetical protein
MPTEELSQFCHEFLQVLRVGIAEIFGENEKMVSENQCYVVLD